MLAIHLLLAYVCQAMDPIAILGKERFSRVDVRVRVRGGGQVSQIYGILTV